MNDPVRPRLGKGDPSGSDQAPKQPGFQTERAVVRDDGPQTGTDTVTIGCKVPNGIVLKLYDMVTVETTVNGVVIKEKQALLREGEQEYTLNGFSIDLGKMAGGIPPEHQIIGGFGLTTGIPRDFAEEWFKQNAQAMIVRNGLIFMEGTENRARGHAKEFASLQSGLQPVDQNDPSTRAGLRKGTITKEVAGATA
jgi:hypothetical protein